MGVESTFAFAVESTRLAPTLRNALQSGPTKAGSARGAAGEAALKASWNDRFGSRALWLAAALYLFFRAFVLHTNFDAVAIPNFELPVMGNLAELGSSAESGAPLGRYYDNCGGQVLTGLLAAPLYALFGDRYLTLKLVPLALGLATLWIVWRILARHYDRRAADVFALLFVLGPPTLAKYSLLAKGNHFENLAFQVLALGLALRALARGSRPLDVFLAAAALGFALFVYFGTVVLALLVALLFVAVRGRRVVRDLAPAAAGFALGLAPLVWFQIAADGQPLAFLRTRLRGAPRGGWSGFEGRLAAFFTDVLPRAGVFEALGPVSRQAAEALFLALFALAWCVLAIVGARRVWRLRVGAPSPDLRAQEARRLEAWKLAPFVLYLPCFALAISAARFDFDLYQVPVEVGTYRYLVPHFLVALCAMALAASELWKRGGFARGLAGALATGALATGAFTLPIADWSGAQKGYAARYVGHCFVQYPNVVLRDPARRSVGKGIPWNTARVTRELAGLSPAHRREAWIGVGHYAAWAQRLERPSAEPFLDLDALVAPYPAEFREELARGAGSYLRRFAFESGERERVGRELASLERAANPLVPALAEGLCLDVRYPLVRRDPTLVGESAELEPLVPPALLPDYFRGRGVQIGRIAGRGLEPDLALAHWTIEQVPHERADAFWSGYGRGLVEGAEGAAFDPRAEALVPESQRARVREGEAEASARIAASDARLTTGCAARSSR